MRHVTAALREVAAGHKVPDLRDLCTTAAWLIDQLDDAEVRLVIALARATGTTEAAVRHTFALDREP